MIRRRTVDKKYRAAAWATLWDEDAARGFPPAIERLALRKLIAIHHATSVNDLRVPPGNRLEKLRGGRAGQHSIRVDDQWRICFRWEGRNGNDVEIVDNH